MIVNIKATFACDRCSTQFRVPIDPAYTPSLRWCMMQVAEDAIRSGHGHENAAGKLTKEMAAMFGTDHYCQSCTVKRDLQEEENVHQPIRRDMKTYTRAIGKLDLSSPNWAHVESVEYVDGMWCLVLRTVAGGDEADSFSRAYNTADLDAEPTDRKEVVVTAPTADDADRAIKAHLLGKDTYTTLSGRKANVRVK